VAWWSALIYLSVMILSATATFLVTTPADLFAGMHLAETEREIVRDVPLRSYHLLLLFVPPLLLTLALLLAWRRDFGLGVDKKADKRQVESDFT
jgi:ABC-type molybdate transport system permease subunit